MPVVLSAEHGGWVRVAPKRSLCPQKQAEVLRSGALSYFACTPPPPAKPTKLPSFPKYDLDGDDILPKTRSRQAKSHQGRACSAPGPRPGYSYSRADPDEEQGEDEEEEEGEEEEVEDFNYHGRHHDDAMSIRSRERERPAGRLRGDSYSGGSSSNSSSRSNRSGESARRTTPAPTPAPVGQSRYWTGPSNKYARRMAGSSSSSSFGRRNVSERWASATQPLVL